MWIEKIEPAIALARMPTGTVSRMSVFTGPVARKIRNIAAARAILEIVRSAAAKATNAAGAVSNELNASTHA